MECWLDLKQFERKLAIPIKFLKILNIVKSWFDLQSCAIYVLIWTRYKQEKQSIATNTAIRYISKK